MSENPTEINTNILNTNKLSTYLLSTKLSILSICHFPLLTLPEENRSIGYWGGKHLEYIRKHRPILFNQLALSGKLKTYLADLNEQAHDRLELIMKQMKKAEGITEALKASDQMAWGRAMNNIRSRAEEIIP